MKELSANRQKCIDKMKADIDTARKHDDYKSYVLEVYHISGERYEERKEYYETLRKYWENARKSIVLVSSYGKPTIGALERAGLVEVVTFEENRNNGVIDTVKLLNY